jgi:hypothetical protein
MKAGRLRFGKQQRPKKRPAGASADGPRIWFCSGQAVAATGGGARA